jgi:hypothetical protein
MIHSLTKKLSAIKAFHFVVFFVIASTSFPTKAAYYQYLVDFSARYGIHTVGDPSAATHRHTFQFEQSSKYSEHWNAVNGFRVEAEAAYASDPERYGSTDVVKYDSQTFLLRDNYLQFRSGSIQVRTGYQQVVWGEAFGAYYADIVNPKDYREAGLGDLAANRLASPMLNLQWIGADSSIQYIYIPVSMPSLLPKSGSDFSAAPLPASLANYKVVLAPDPKSNSSRGEMGLRITKQIFDFDFSAFYLNYYDRLPVYRLRAPTAPLTLNVDPEYMPLQTAGMTMTVDFSGFLVRAEVLQHMQREVNILLPSGLNSAATDELVYVLGLDLPPMAKWQFGLQFSESKLLQSPPLVNGAVPAWAFRESSQSLISARIARTFGNDLSIEALATQFLLDQSTLVQAKMTLPLASQLELILGADSFDGLPASQLGRYKTASRAWVMLKATIKK